MSQKAKLIQIRKLLAGIADGSLEAKESAARAVALIEDIIGQQKGRGEADVRYTIEDTVNGPALTERRSGSSTFPIRCPKPVYDSMVKTLANLDRAVPLDELAAAVEDDLGDQPPDYQLRVPLRLWMSSSPPLILRNRARYRVAISDPFRAAAKKLWSGLQAGG